jgi:hypothetical protein
VSIRVYNLEEVSKLLPLQETPLPMCRIVDDTFNLPDYAWVFGDFQRYWQGELHSLRLPPYSARHDCDNYAFEYKRAMMRSHYASGGRGAAPAVALMSYRKSPGVLHQANLVLVVLNGEPRRCYVEPQTGCEISLTPAEEESICFLYL